MTASKRIKPPSPPWTAEQDRVVLEAIRESLTTRRRPDVCKLAAQVGRTYEATNHRLAYLRDCLARGLGRYDSRADGPRQELLSRRCLTCGSHFVAPGRFIRVCAGCKRNSVWQAGA